EGPSTSSSTAAGATPASARASRATRTIRLSTVSPSRRPNGVCAQPTMQAVTGASFILFRSRARFPTHVLQPQHTRLQPVTCRILDVFLHHEQKHDGIGVHWWGVAPLPFILHRLN